MENRSGLRGSCVELFKKLHGTDPVEVDSIDDEHGGRVHLRTDDAGEVRHVVVIVSRWTKA